MFYVGVPLSIYSIPFSKFTLWPWTFSRCKGSQPMEMLKSISVRSNENIKYITYLKNTVGMLKNFIVILFYFKNFYWSLWRSSNKERLYKLITSFMFLTFPWYFLYFNQNKAYPNELIHMFERLDCICEDLGS